MKHNFYFICYFWLSASSFQECHQIRTVQRSVLFCRRRAGTTGASSPPSASVTASWAPTDPTVMFVFYFVRRDEPGDTIHTLNEVLSTRRREASSKEHCLFGFQDGDCETGLGSNEGLRRLCLASHRSSNMSPFHHLDMTAAREAKNCTPNQDIMYRQTWFIKAMFRTNEKELQDIVTEKLTWTVSNHRAM